MTQIYRTPEFSLTQAAVDQMNFIRGEYLSHFPDDPPVLAGIATGQRLTGEGAGQSQVIIGFWRRSEVSDRAWKEEAIIEVAGLKIVFNVLRQYRPMFSDAAIDYSPEHAFSLRPME